MNYKKIGISLGLMAIILSASILPASAASNHSPKAVRKTWPFNLTVKFHNLKHNVHLKPLFWVK